MRALSCARGRRACACCGCRARLRGCARGVGRAVNGAGGCCCARRCARRAGRCAGRALDGSGGSRSRPTARRRARSRARGRGYRRARDRAGRRDRGRLDAPHRQRRRRHRGRRHLHRRTLRAERDRRRRGNLLALLCLVNVVNLGELGWRLLLRRDGAAHRRQRRRLRQLPALTAHGDRVNERRRQRGRWGLRAAAIALGADLERRFDRRRRGDRARRLLFLVIDLTRGRRLRAVLTFRGLLFLTVGPERLALGVAFALRAGLAALALRRRAAAADRALDRTRRALGNHRRRARTRDRLHRRRRRRHRRVLRQSLGAALELRRDRPGDLAALAVSGEGLEQRAQDRGVAAGLRRSGLGRALRAATTTTTATALRRRAARRGRGRLTALRHRRRGLALLLLEQRIDLRRALETLEQEHFAPPSPQLRLPIVPVRSWISPLTEEQITVNNGLGLHRNRELQWRPQISDPVIAGAVPA